MADMNSPTSCAISTADESNHSAMGMLHLHGNATCILYVTLHQLSYSSLSKKKFAPSQLEIFTPKVPTETMEK